MSYFDRGPYTKWYVRNGDVRVLVTAQSALDACLNALDKIGYNDTTDGHRLPWDCFTVDQMGFKDIEGSMVVNDNADIDVGRLVYAQHVVETEEVLDYWDEITRKYDPFCEHDDYFREMGESENE